VISHTTVWQDVCVRCAKFPDVIMKVILREKCCTNICMIIIFYFAMSILVYIHGCNCKFCNAPCFIIVYI